MEEINYRITLVNIYSTDTLAKYLLSSYLLKAYLRKFFDEKMVSIEILNFNSDTDYPEICDSILKTNPNLVGYSSYIWNIEKILKTINIIRGNSNSILHVLGGPEISITRILSLKNPSTANFYVIGEGERKFYDLISYLIGKKEFPKGVAFWAEDKIVYTEDKNHILNLDEIPSIYLNEILEENLYAGRQAFLETQRGCRFKCKYCVYHKNLSGISYYSLERIFDELDFLISKKRIRALRIFDAIFTSDIKRAKKIVEHILDLKNKGVLLPWIYWEMTPYNVDEEFFKLIASLKDKGKINNTDELKPLDRPQFYSDMLKHYAAVNCVGIQSFCRESLAAISRMVVSEEKFDSFMKMAKRYNVALKIDMILGLPFETFNSYFKGLEFMLPYFKDTDHILNIHRLQILPGSELEDICTKYKIRYSSAAPHEVYSTNAFSEKELNYASKLTGLLFRIINSPLRKSFFEYSEKTGKSYFRIIEEIFNKLMASEEFAGTKFVRDTCIDDTYWNTDIFRELPSKWFLDFFKQ